MRPWGPVMTETRPPASGPPGAVRGPRRDVPLTAGFLLVFLVGGSANVADLDLWHGLSLIREALETGSLPARDVFAYTPTVEPVVHHEWGASAIVYLAATLGGAPGLLLLKYLLLAALVTAVALTSRMRGADVRRFLLLALVAIPMSWIGMTAVRAQLFTLVLLGALLVLLELDRRGRRWWMVPWLLLYVVWLNVHGGFVVGLVLYSAHAVEQALRRRPVRHLVVAGGLLLALIAANPYGVSYYGYLVKALTLDRSSIREWGPLWELGPLPLVLFGLSFVIAAHAVMQRGLRSSPGWLLLLLGALAALRTQRHLSLYAVLWLAYVPSLLEGSGTASVIARTLRRRPLFLPLAAGLLAVVGLADLVRNRAWELRIPARPGEHRTVVYPVGAVRYLRQQGFRGNLMTPFEYGAFVSWKLYPDVRVSLDSRYEVAYPPEALEESLDFYLARPGWRKTLEKYPTDAVLVPRRLPVARMLADLDSWTQAYEDDAYRIFTRPGLDLPREDRRGERPVGEFP